MIYYIYNYNDDAVKIGYAKSERNLWLRYEGFQVGSATPLIMLKYEEGTQQDEYNKHKQFANLRIRGEWFFYDGALKDYIDSDLDVNYKTLDILNADYIHDYHAKKYNKNTKISYVKIRGVCDSLVKNGSRDMSYFVYDNLLPNEDFNKFYKNLKHCINTSKYANFQIHRKGLNEIKTLFCKKDGHLLPITNVKHYLKEHNILNKNNTGTIPVSIVAEIFNTEIVVEKIKGKATRCLVGLDYAQNR